MDKETAFKIIKENYPYENFKPLTTDKLLEISKGSDYRPYYVTAYLIKSEYRQVTRVDEVYMSYPKDSINSLLGIQKSLDKTISDIPPEHSIETLLEPNDIVEFSAFTTTNKNLKYQ